LQLIRAARAERAGADVARTAIARLGAALQRRRERAELRLTIASYNVHRCVGADGKCDVARIASVIAELGADLVGLQEVDGGYHTVGTDQMRELARAARMFAVAGPTMVRGNGHYGNVLLTRAPTSAVRHLDLSVRDKEPRGAIDVDLAIAGRLVRMVVTHLGLRRFERVLQVEQILRCVKVALPGTLTIVAGDFNEWRPDDQSLRPLHVRFGRSRLRTFPARRPLFAFDRILVEPRGALLEHSVHDSPLARVASDHLPVKAVIDF
jgi:endonuclease/exonuclease/phosphatase family metal-dependent hydrolase